MQNNALARTKDILWAVALAGLAAAALRFGLGLGATTGLNDAAPWGLWIAFKLGFVALSGGGFTLAAMVYIFHLETYRPLLRRAILLALLGYGSFIVSLIFDLGLPWHIYMPVVRWQHHSVMFEIAWCVMLYFTVLALEFAPVILEHPWFRHPLFKRLIDFLHVAIIPLVIAGIVLSTLHQSSLGALFLIMPHRVHPLWYSPLIPVLFFVSAIAAGLLALIVESRLAQILFRRDPDDELLARLGKIAAFTLWLYLGVRLVDLLARGVLPGALDGSWQSQLFLLEILAGGVLPAALLASPRIRSTPAGLVSAALLAIAGILSQRMALSMFAMRLPNGAAYTPSLLETVIAFAIPAAAGLVYLFFMENLAVQPEGAQVLAPVQPRRFAPNSPAYTFAARSGLAVLAFALTGAVFTGGAGPAAAPVARALGWETLTIDGDRDGVFVRFPHAEHQERLSADAAGLDSPQGAAGCTTCHHLSIPEDEATACSACHRDYYAATPIFDHTHHTRALGGNAACSECHTGEHRAATAAACQECHEDMLPLQDRADFSSLAAGYKDAMHGRCLACHTQQAGLQDRPELAVCSTCHAGEAENLLAIRKAGN